MEKSADVLVVGAGPGGYVAAIKLGKLGKKTIVVDKDKLGGECLNYGCIPSKAMISAANLVHRAKHAADIGITVSDVRVDMSKVQTWKSNLIGGFNRGIGTLLKGNGVESVAGEARFTGPNNAQVGADTVRFESAIIATGSRPIELPAFKIDGKVVISSKEALELQEIPSKLLVIGGGIIGLEIGMFYAKLGSKVTVVELTQGLLPGVDAELVRPVQRSLQKLGVDVFLGAMAKSWAAQGASAVATVQTPEGEKQIECDKILLSVGRKPNTDTLGLEAAGVERDAKGFITVNERYQTSAANIYAIGDLIGPPFLAHKASREGILAAQAIASEDVEPIGPIPWAIFTDPEIAFAGLTEAQAKEQGIDAGVGRFPFAACGRAQTARETDGFVKVLCDKSSGRLVGVGIVGPEASDLISEASLAVRLKATVHDIASTIHPHPTLAEAILEAAEAAMGQAIHVLAPARR